MNPYQESWQRLAAAARNTRDDRDCEAPYGFSARVAALAMSEERRPMRPFEYFAMRAVGLACLLAVASVAVNYSAITRLIDSHSPAPSDDPIAELVDIAS
jgi:hypothetical protein